MRRDDLITVEMIVKASPHTCLGHRRDTVSRVIGDGFRAGNYVGLFYMRDDTLRVLMSQIFLVGWSLLDHDAKCRTMLKIISMLKIFDVNHIVSVAEDLWIDHQKCGSPTLTYDDSISYEALIAEAGNDARTDPMLIIGTQSAIKALGTQASAMYTPVFATSAAIAAATLTLPEGACGEHTKVWADIIDQFFED
jgi:hypothetical protein